MGDGAVGAGKPATSDETGPAPGPEPPARQAVFEQRRQLVAASLRVGNLGNHAGDLPEHADPVQDCQIEVCVDEIRAYEHNPRHADNAKYAEIKESIRAGGLRNPFTVTRRPGEAHFIVEAGGNTRLQILQELWAETGEPRFQKVKALFRPWRSESHVLTAHLIENEQRGDLSFWDKATGVVALRRQLEAERGETLSLRQFEEALGAIGLPVSMTRLSQYLFATERLGTLGTAVPDLTGLDVRILQPRLNLLKRHAQRRTGISEDVLYGEVFEEVFARHAAQWRESKMFPVAGLCLDIEVALARHLGQTPKQLRAELEGLARESANLSVGNGEALPEEGGKPSSENGDANGSGVHTVNGSSDFDTSTALTATVRGVNASTTSREHDAAPTEAWKARSLVAIRRRLERQIERFTALAGIGDCWRTDDDAPRGYVMTPLIESEGVGPASDLQRRAWWLLAAASGQWDENPAGPPQSAFNGDKIDQETSAVPSRSQTLPPDASFLRWLTDGRDEAAGAFWELATTLRALRATDHDARPSSPSESQATS